MANSYLNYRKLLDEFISFKSISTDPHYTKDITKTVEWLNMQFTKRGFKVTTIKGYGNPLVLAEVNVNPQAQTVLVYGHYDVQPADKNDGWKGDPFTVVEDKDKLYARGIIDNKGQILTHISSIFDLLSENKLKFNVKFLIEGDEETGSKNIRNFFEDHYKKLSADFILISDGETTGIHPCLDSSFRGAINMVITVKTSSKDNHSGLYGGSIPNAATELVNLLSKLHNENGELIIPGVNAKKKFQPEILKNNKNIPYQTKDFIEIAGVKKRFNDGKIDFYTQTGFLTSAEITTLSAGYMGDGFRNAIPGEAIAKVNFRLAPDVSVKEFIPKLEKYIKSIKPNYLDVSLDPKTFNDGFFVDTQNEVAKNAKDLLANIYKTEVYDRPCGAIIPIVGLFIKYLSVPLVSIGLANEDCNMHGANENFRKSFLEKGLAFSKKFFSI